MIGEMNMFDSRIKITLADKSKEQVRTMEERWQEALDDGMYHLWSMNGLEIEREACLEFIDTYTRLGYSTEVERLTLKVKHLDKIIKDKQK